MEITKEELSAIKALERLAKKWPDSLWLFCNGCSVHILKKNENGERVLTEGGGMDDGYVVGYVNIENDGGDW